MISCEPVAVKIHYEKTYQFIKKSSQEASYNGVSDMRQNRPSTLSEEPSLQ
jgi:hypothetical protein